jgi:hypothetical protein
MKHIRIHRKIVEHLKENGDATTGEIQDWLRELKPANNRPQGAGHMSGQSLNVLGNVLRRKPIVKKGFDPSAGVSGQAIWGIDGY